MTSGTTGTPGSGGPPADGALAWHTLGTDQVLHSEGVDGQRGLSSAEAAARAERFGPNTFAAGQAESRWHAFFRQYRDPMQLVLLAAGIGSLYPLKQLGTGILLILLTLFNAVEGLHQEGKATAAVSALQKMVIIKARVRRDGQLAEIPAERLVPGDIVAIDAGDIVPADGRLLKAATLEVDESALTGESMPVAKGTEPVAGADTPLGDRADMVYVPGSRALDPSQPVLPARRDPGAGPPGPDLAICRRRLAGAEGVRHRTEDFTKLDITTMKGIKRTARRLGPPLGHRLDGRLLGYEEARRLLYLPAYRWMLDHRAAGLVARLRELSSHRTVVLLDYTTNGDVTDLSVPLSHAALIAQLIEAPTQAGPVQADDR